VIEQQVSWVQYIFTFVVSGGMGWLVGFVLFNDKARHLRKWLWLAFVALLVVVSVWSRSSFGFFVIFIAGVAAGAMMFKAAVTAGTRRKSTAFGSAEWATIEDMRNGKLIDTAGLRLGQVTEFTLADGVATPHAHALGYAGDRHLLTVAPTRSGKGVSAIIPNLLTYTGSAVVIDPKGENAMITAARRGQGSAGVTGLGQQVHVVDPWGVTGLPTACFNPLDWLRADDPDISENAMMLADSIVIPGEGKDRFWDEEAKAILMGLLLYVALDAREQGTRTLARVRDIVVSGVEAFNAVLGQMVESDNPIVVSTADRTAGKAPELRASVMASLQSHTHFLDSPRIRASLAKSDFGFADLKAAPTTVYLVLPSDRLNTFGRWLRLLIQQAITVNARNIAQKPPKPILFLLDEMPALGRLAMVEQAYGLMAGFGMQLWGIVQDLSQLERIYDKGWETFISNAGVLQYFGSRDQKTAEYFSKLCGVTTIEKTSISNSIARAFGSSSPGGGSSSSTSHTESTNTDVAQRHLAFADELMVMRKGQQLLFVEEVNPIMAQRSNWYEHPELKALGVNLHQPG
jgi:type IV secretion system protein VirD4